MRINGIDRVGKDSAFRAEIRSGTKCKSCKFLLGRCEAARVTRVNAGGYSIIQECDMYEDETLTIDDLKQLSSKTKTNLYRITGLLVVVKEGYLEIIQVDIQSAGATGADAANNYTRHLANYDRVQWATGPYAKLIESESEA